jgi:hypothetical protein
MQRQDPMQHIPHHVEAALLLTEDEIFSRLGDAQEVTSETDVDREGFVS